MFIYEYMCLYMNIYAYRYINMSIYIFIYRKEGMLEGRKEIQTTSVINVLPKESHLLYFLFSMYFTLQMNENSKEGLIYTP